ncbi:hypothetical protein WN51_14230 [Melipona quadrifasciata]|uniref:Ig-like domain-containing protein n=2 Tax=Meliponini TaxID=83319 RepID=A0A0N0U5L1_9HYME|nr:hypothetical protein WN51_14230 [Melipona quadrifasciata]
MVNDAKRERSSIIRGPAVFVIMHLPMFVYLFLTLSYYKTYRHRLTEMKHPHIMGVRVQMGVDSNSKLIELKQMNFVQIPLDPTNYANRLRSPYSDESIQRPQANQQQFDFGLELPDGSNYNAVDSVLPDSDHSARGLRSWHRLIGLKDSGNKNISRQNLFPREEGRKTKKKKKELSYREPNCSLLLKLQSDYDAEEQSARDHYTAPCFSSNGRKLQHTRIAPYSKYKNCKEANLDLNEIKAKSLSFSLESSSEKEERISFAFQDPRLLFMKISNLANIILIKIIFSKSIDSRSVSWVRHRDIHLLTVGRYTYTSDQRFEALHLPHAEEWTLRIRYPQRKDSGIYECQISTTPPIGHPVYLTIVDRIKTTEAKTFVSEPVTIIVGAPDLFVNKGSTINLTCVVRYAPEPPPMMIWSHNTEFYCNWSTYNGNLHNHHRSLGSNKSVQPMVAIDPTVPKVINFDSPRGGISLVTEKGPETTSRLMIQKAVLSDSGIYTCEPSNANPSSIKVHVVNEERPAAMHHGDGSSSYAETRPICFIILIVANVIFV